MKTYCFNSFCFNFRNNKEIVRKYSIVFLSLLFNANERSHLVTVSKISVSHPLIQHRMNDTRINFYDGTTSPQDFAARYRVLALLESWDAAAQLANLPLFLQGKAKRLYEAVTPKTTLKEALDGLIRACDKPKESSLFEFYQRRFQPPESISDFANSL